MRRAKRLSLKFYQRDTIDVARDLLGKVLVHKLPNGKTLAGKIVETEAYLGVDDPAAHSFGGRRTARNEAMYLRAGHTYVYFIYGMHFCFNVVTAAEGVPEAVLVRALEPLDGEEFSANGPGKLCRALQIGRDENALDLCANKNLWIEDRFLSVNESEFIEGPRVGIGLHLDHIHWPLRFGLRDHSALSPTRFPDYMSPP